MTRTLLAAVTAVFSLSLGSVPPSAPDRPAIEAAVGHYFKAGDTSSSAELREAFHPAAMMFFVKDGALQGVSQPEWWARADANKSPVVAVSRQIPIVDVAGDVAFAKVVSVYPTHRFADYMSLMKIDGRWWIVGKIFHRFVPPDAPAAPAATVSAEREAIRAVLEKKLQAMDEDDGALLASVYEPRAMTYTVLDGRLVGVPVAEWSARFAARKAKAEAPPKATRKLFMIDVEGDAAIARLDHELPAGRWIDYASLLKVGGQWKIVGLLYANQGVGR